MRISMQVEFLTCTKEQLLAQVTQVPRDKSIYHKFCLELLKVPNKFWWVCSSSAGLAQLR